MVCVLGVEIKDTMQTNARRDQRKSVTLLDRILLNRRNLHLKKLSRDAKHRKERKGYTSRRSDSESSKVKFGLNAIDASADEMEQYLRSLTHEGKRNIGVLSDSSSDSHH